MDHSRSGSARYSGFMANTVSRAVPGPAVPAVLRPWAITAEFGADADCTSCFQKPEATMFDHGSSGNRPSTVHVAGTSGNQVGGSMIAVSWLGKAPTIGLPAPAALFQYTMALLPLPVLDAAVSPLTSEPAVRKLTPFVPAPRYPPPPAAKNAWSRALAVLRLAEGYAPVFQITS